MAEDYPEETSAVEETDDTPEGAYVDGVFVTTSELRDGYMRNANYTQKTQTLAEERAEITAQKVATDKAASDAAEALALANAKESALATDTKWYSEHPQDEWEAYQPEINRLSNGAVIPSTVSAPTAITDSETKAKLDKIIEQNEAKNKAERMAALETSVDRVLSEVDRVRKADFPLADTDLVQAKIEAHQSINSGKLPSNLEIRQFSKEVHDKFVKSGARVPAGIKTESDKNDLTPGSPNVGISAKHLDIDINADPDNAERALKDYMAAKLAAQES